MAYGFSAKIPLQHNPEDGYYVLTKTIPENIKQNFKNLLLTSPGERVMIPSFGVGLRHYLFTNAGTMLESEITERIENQVESYMPFLLINNINYLKHDPPFEAGTMRNRLGIQIVYSVPRFNFSDTLRILELPVS